MSSNHRQITAQHDTLRITDPFHGFSAVSWISAQRFAPGRPVQFDAARPPSITQQRGREWLSFTPSSPAESYANDRASHGAEASRKWSWGARLWPFSTKQVPWTLHPGFPAHKEKGCTDLQGSLQNENPSLLSTFWQLPGKYFSYKRFTNWHDMSLISSYTETRSNLRPWHKQTKYIVVFLRPVENWKRQPAFSPVMLALL